MVTSELLSEVSEWISGPAFVLFLEGQGINQYSLGDTVNFTELRKGQNISVWRADRILTKIGLHIRQLPEQAWLPLDHKPYYIRNSKLKRDRNGCYAAAS